MVKVGDRVKLVKENGAWCSDNVGKEGTVTAFDGGKYVDVLFDNSERHRFENDWGNISHLEIISTTTTFSIPADTETITLKYADGSTQDIDVKDRARGVPEWVKDGSWVVRKDNGYIHQVKETKSGIFHLTIDSEYSIRITHHIYGQYRPFTNSDWKWGMWAEYEGEKVFVCENSAIGVYASRKTDPYFFATYSELTPTTAP